MKYYKTVDEYILNTENRKEILIILREILKGTELKETIKWGSPVYTFNGKNVVGIGAFKSYAGIWFFQGALLKNEEGVLVNAQEGTTKALRQWRFSDVNEIDEKLVLKYVNEAIENQKKGKEIKADRKKTLVIPDELKEAFLKNKELEIAFNEFTTGKKREFADYISQAKQEATRLKRVEKIRPLILKNIGLNDKYRK
ncbi:YdeI/OmpD-associated family protein [Maribellus maritimus]|uniref:YdeI/OmpD-associated family protein n=1 Tax=Maribellus maritimus TaxID=2870838 RepID=UPI001EEA659A|nr:DUF1801 domain-containing protein [Maribellus maritimus]MCG6188009.1 YdeI/OmpD-associated family protein [Maribellus maritimus]